METAVVGLAEQGARSSVVRLPTIMHGTADAGFLPMLIALAKEKGATGYPGDGANVGAAGRSYLPIAGDSAPAKAAVTEFIDSIGCSVADAGPLADSWRQAAGVIGRWPRVEDVVLRS